MSEGASLTEIDAYLDIDNETRLRIMKDEEIFSATIKRGLRLSKTWWEQSARKSLRDKEFNATLWYMNMKNRFGWRDKQDITSNDKELSINLVDSGYLSRYNKTDESSDRSSE